MEVDKIPDGKGGNYLVMAGSDIERVDPVEYYANWDMTVDIVLSKELIQMHRLPFPDSMINRVLLKNAKEEWDKRYKEIKSIEIPENLKKLFTANKKKDQVKLLKGVSITTDILLAFLFYAWEEHGYSFSQYIAEHQRTGLNKSELPQLVYVEGNKVERIGSSKLTDGQLKQAVQERKVIVSKFLDKGADWHCIFATYNSLGGAENWQNGQPHFHYISSKFGISRDDAVASLKSKNYQLGSLPHIKLTDYGVQPK